ncbi:G-protein coupled receptor 55-like [Mantella aurantiaca]
MRLNLCFVKALCEKQQGVYSVYEKSSPSCQADHWVTNKRERLGEKCYSDARMENKSYEQGIQYKANASDIHPTVQLVQLVLYIPTFIFGFAFNMLALWMLFFRIKKWVEATTFMTALIIFDSLLLVTLPFKIKAYTLGESWNLGVGTCTFLQSLYFVNLYGSILISVCICMDRYLAIQFPFHAKLLRSPKKAAIVCAMLCIFIWGASIGLLVNLRDANGRCFYAFSSRTWSSRTMVTVLGTVFLISAVLLIFCTSHIILTLKKNKQANMHKAKVIKVLMANLITFVLSFVPFHVALLLYYFARNDIIPEVYKGSMRIFLQISLCVSNINCFLDGVCYYCILREFVKSIKKSPMTS